MIRYTLRCARTHSFESWFQSASAFDALAGAGMLECPVCGERDVSKAMMAPRVSAPGDDSPDHATTDGGAEPKAPASPGALSDPSATEQALARLRQAVEKTSDYVGSRFAQEVRSMHTGESPERSVHGEARPDEARALLEDGIPILPLPFRSGKTN